jgi:hypothetical protein
VDALYVEFASSESTSHPKLALHKRPALAEDLGVLADGTGSHHIALGSNAEAFTDPDGFAWEAAESLASATS